MVGVCAAGRTDYHTPSRDTETLLSFDRKLLELDVAAP